MLLPSRPLAVASLLALALSCQQRPAETTASPLPAAPAPQATPVAAAPTVAQRFSPIISGYWVSVEYLDEVAHTRSPEAAFDHTPQGPSSLAISPFSTRKDSVEIGATYGLHEGGNLMLLLPPPTEATTLNLRSLTGGEAEATDEITYQVTATDTVLFYITRRKKTRQIISKVAYHRAGISTNAADLEQGVEQAVNKLLVVGQYNGLDSLNHLIHARFYADGKVEGLSFDNYLIQTDFTGPNSGNTIIFDAYTKQRKEFAASFGRDTLSLYTIHSSTGIAAGQVDTANVFSRGRLRYQLVRVGKP